MINNNYSSRPVRCKPYKGIIRAVFEDVKYSAKRRNIDFSVSIEYVGDLFEKQKGICPLTGRKLRLKKSTRDHTQTASLDRKNSSRGYVKGNLQWVLKSVNMLKNNLTEKQFVSLCNLVVSHHNNKISKNGIKKICGKSKDS